jgi:hypothetical protein
MRIILIVILFIFSCNSKQERSAQLEQLQNVFGTANWQVIKGIDTSYIFFSPQADNSFKTYHYNLFRGDSINTEMGSIKQNGNEEVEWVFFNKTLMLYNINDNEMGWKDKSNKIYVLAKQNDSLLLMQIPNGELQFKKALPLSTFLVRAKYDYEHGSKLKDSVQPYLNRISIRGLLRDLSPQIK